MFINKISINNKIELKMKASQIGSCFILFVMIYPIQDKISNFLPLINTVKKIHVDSQNTTRLYNTFANLNISMPLNWLLTIGELQVFKWGKISHNIVHNLENESPENSYLITDKKNIDASGEMIFDSLYVYPVKNYFAPKNLKLNENAITTGKINAGINFYLKKGFSQFNDWGHWTIGSESIIHFRTIRNENDKKLFITFKITGYVLPGHEISKFSITINKNKIADYEINQNGWNTYKIQLPQTSLENNYEIKIHNFNPVAPKNITNSNDEREINIGISEIILSN
jgi:hypothetical protein